MSFPAARVVACLALVGFALGALPAEARCKQPALISTFETATIFSYILTPGVDPVPDSSSSMTAAATGHFWALGFGDPEVGLGLDDGSFAAVDGELDGWLDLPLGYSATILTTWAADERIDNCIDDATSDPDCTAILLGDRVEDGTTYFTLMTASETATRDYLFNLPGNAPIVLAPIPPPVAIGRGSDVSAIFASPVLPPDGFHLDPACASAQPEDVVVGYKVYWYRQSPGLGAPAERAPATDPTMLRGWWPAVGGVSEDGGPLPLGQDATIDVGCQPYEVYTAIRLVFDSGYETAYVSDIGGAGTTFPVCACAGTDDDGDGFCADSGDAWQDCDDNDATVFPAAPALCDGRNNDCLDPIWPALPDGEVDHDGDGFAACLDCDDDDPTAYPGAPETCDGQINRCGGMLPLDEIDEDGDGWLACEGDCAPNISTIYPGAPEVCDNRNNDCNHPRWPDISGSETTDNDGDGISECDGDCWDFQTFGDDDVPGGDIYPGAPEQCDGVANDCDDPNWPEPVVEEGDPDNDGDGFSICGGGDCDDLRPTVYPGAPEVCDGLNNDCNDPEWPDAENEEADIDNDGFAACEGDCLDRDPRSYPGAPQICDGVNNDCDDPNWPDLPADEVDADDDGSVACADCDDTNPAVYPGAQELCDGLNNNCDDPNWPVPPPADQDGDGDGTIRCADCDDADATVYPGAPEVCDGLNNDCSDPNWPEPSDEEADLDGDGRTTCDGDCRDFDPSVYPGAPQICDGVNNDCDDPNWPELPPEEEDNDGDNAPMCADCDDTNGDIYPGSPQFCDGLNNDCNDPNWPEVPATELDSDGDGFLLCAECDDGDAMTYPDAPQLCGDGVNNDCRHPQWPSLNGTNEDDFDDDGFSECEGDCSPLRRFVYPGAPEICDGLNNDCDDPNWPDPPAEEVDNDGDQFVACADCDDDDPNTYPRAPQFCDGINTDCEHPSWPDPPAEELDGDGDGFLFCAECDDTEAAVYPGAPEVCDGLNNDCLDPDWPATTNEDLDDDGDGLSACDGDCNDNDMGTYPGAPQVCDGVNNDCADPDWPALPEDERDGDGDFSPACDDCDDSDPRILPLGPQVCDGINNDCLHPNYPGLEATNEFDDDGDGFTECAGDCADDDPQRSPDVDEDCDNGIDDDCDGLIDYFDAADCRDLLVVLESFTATAEDGGVRIRWTTSQEIESAGFHVLRSKGGRNPVRVTPQPIPSQGDALHGADYEFFDATRQRTDNLRYWLAEIDNRGEVTRFGPITVSQPAQAAANGRSGR